MPRGSRRCARPGPTCCARADAPNVFMDPALVARRGRGRSRRRTSRVAGVEIDRTAARSWLASGASPSAVARQSVLPIPVLTVPAVRHGYLATPVVDRNCLDETLDAMLDCIAADPRTAEDRRARHDGHRTGRPMKRCMRVLAAARQRALHVRAVPAAEARLRARRQDLSGAGALQLDPQEAAPAPPQACGKRRAHLGRSRPSLTPCAARWRNSWRWKRRAGRAGRAPRCSATRPTRRSCAARSARWPSRLCIDPFALSRRQAGEHADRRALRRRGVHLEDRLRRGVPRLLAGHAAARGLHRRVPRGQSIAFVDSCSFDDTGFMSAWTERQPVADLWIDVRRGGSLAFRVAERLAEELSRPARSGEALLPRLAQVGAKR